MKAWSYFILLVSTVNLMGQDFYFGNDLSYVNQMEDCGGDFKENGVSKDVYQIFADRGTNLVRLRLWVDPTWQNSLTQPDGVKDQYSDYPDVKEAISRSKKAGMEVMLGFQFSDGWADPGRQAVPARWRDVAYDLEALKDSVYNYVAQVLSDLEKDTLMPEFVKIGNEANPGILIHEYFNEDWSAGPVISWDWDRQAELFNSAIQAVRDVSDTTEIKPKIALHCAGLDAAAWWFDNIINRGVTDFDIMGFSYYYAWHEASISQMGNRIRSLLSSHPEYEVMVVEMGYLWTTKNFDNLGNIITTPDPRYLPVIPEKQLEYLVDYTRSVMRAGGSGVIFWEPAWISTPCRTPWGQGSSHDHVVFFDPDSTNFMENGGGTWMQSPYYDDLDTKKVTFWVDMTDQDVSKGVYISGSWTGDEWEILPMAHVGNDIYYYFTYLPPGDTGGFYFLNDTVWEARETLPSECANWNGTDRQYTVGESNLLISSIWGACNPDMLENNSGRIANKIQIFPNPNHGLLNLKFMSSEKGTTLHILDLNGVLQMKFEREGNETEKMIDISTLSPGLYVIQICDQKNCFYKKIIRI